MKRTWFFGSALVLGALGTGACGNGDDNSSPAAATDAGAATDAVTLGDAASDAQAPLDATAPRDAAGDADAARAPDATVSSEAGGPDGAVVADAGGVATIDAGLLADAGDGSAPAFALFVGTDFVTAAELSAVALAPDAIAGRMPLADQDSVPYASGGYGFVLADTIGETIVLDRAHPWMATATIDVNDPADASSGDNPHAVVVTAATRAYVARYGSNVLKVIDVAAGTVTGNLDLSAFVAPDDGDGLIDVQDGVYDPVTQRVYLLLQRINQQDFGDPPDYVGACLASPAEIVAVDGATGAIVPLHGDAGSPAIDLLGDDPAALTPDFAHGRILVADTGCTASPDGGADAGDPIRVGRGVESVTLATGTATWLYQTSEIQRLSGLILVDTTHAFVNEGDDWFAWDPTQPALGNVVSNFPLAAVYDGTSRILGLSATDPAAGTDAGITWSVVSLDVGTLQLTTVAANPFQSVTPPNSKFAVNGVLLR